MEVNEDLKIVNNVHNENTGKSSLVGRPNQRSPNIVDSLLCSFKLSTKVVYVFLGCHLRCVAMAMSTMIYRL